MKISDDTRFPHPVLGLDTNDYVTGEFVAKFTVKEDFSKSTVEISIDSSVTDSALSDLVATGKASTGIFVICPATYLTLARPFQLGSSKVQLSASQLWGRVRIQPFIWSNEAIAKWESPNVHKEFSQDGFEIARGAVLAIGEEIAFSVGRDKLAPIESIFEMRRAPSYPIGKATVSLDEEKIVILLSPDVHEAVNNLRANSTGKMALMNSLYLPAIMEVLAILSSSGGNFENRRWYQAFAAKCEFLGIQISSPRIFEDAQKLLDGPAAALRHVAERIA